jgi:hypothetical protein
LRYLFRTPGAQGRVMHIMRFTATDGYTDEALCGAGGFNRSINAPWGLGRPVCKRCRRKAAA